MLIVLLLTRSESQEEISVFSLRRLKVIAPLVNDVDGIISVFMYASYMGLFLQKM